MLEQALQQAGGGQQERVVPHLPAASLDVRSQGLSDLRQHSFQLEDVCSSGDIFVKVGQGPKSWTCSCSLLFLLFLSTCSVGSMRGCRGPRMRCCCWCQQKRFPTSFSSVESLPSSCAQTTMASLVTTSATCDGIVYKTTVNDAKRRSSRWLSY